jgi:phosphomannomutase
MREKDGFQFGFLSLSLAAKLYSKKQSFADYYCELIDKYSIQNRFFHRHDERLYDERLTGEARQDAVAAAEEKKQRIMDFFKNLAKDFENGASAEKIREKLNRHVSMPNASFPLPVRLCVIGESVIEGTYVEFESFWIVVRASGTDAVLRYYIEGGNQKTIKHYQKLIVSMNIS